MVTQNPNPFILPGFGQPGDSTQNPMLASMEMMRKAWEGLASAGGFEQALATPGVSPEDLERRITDLRAVENWLRMNLSMLSSTIQALEVQRATVSTLQAFVASATGAANPASTAPSPLDIALGIRRGPSADSSGLFGEKKPTASTKADEASTPFKAPPAADTGAAASPAGKPVAEEESATPGIAEGAINTWWDMLQTQFDNLASATAATLHGAEAMQGAATPAQQQTADSAPGTADAIKKSAAVKAASAPKAAPVKKTATKKAVKKASAKKVATPETDNKSASAVKTATASKSAANKSVAKKTATKKTASKKTAAKKTVAKKATKTGGS